MPNHANVRTAANVSRFRPGEMVLASGLILGLLTIVLFTSVMFWMLSVLIGPVALMLLTSGLVRIRREAGSSFAGFGLLVFGFGMVAAAGVGATFFSLVVIKSMGLQPALGAPESVFPLMLLAWCGGPLLVHKGLAMWTDWPSGRRTFWVAVAALFPLAALLVHLILGGTGLLPLSA